MVRSARGPVLAPRPEALDLEAQVPHRLRHVGELADVAPGLLEIRDDQLVGRFAHHVARGAGGVGEHQEGLAAARLLLRPHDGLRGAVAVPHLDQVARPERQLFHVVRVHQQRREREAVGDQRVVLVEEGRLPDVVGAAVVDQEAEALLLLPLALGLQAAPLRDLELRPAVRAFEHAVLVQALGADDPAVLVAARGRLDAVGAHGAQPVVGDVLAAFLVGVVAVHEGVLLGAPVVAAETVGHLRLARRPPGRFEGPGEAGDDQAVGQRLAGRVHPALGQAQPALAVHRCQVHLARGGRRQHDVRASADRRGHDVHVHAEQPAPADGAHDGLDQGLAVAGRHGVHRLLHHVGAALVDALVLGGVQGGLEGVAAPDVVHAAVPVDDQLVHVGRGPADVGVGRAHVAFHVPAQAHAAAAGAADVAGGQAEIHERLVGAVVVVAPDQALFIREHGPPPVARLRFGDPGRGLADALGRQAGDARRLFHGGAVRVHRRVEAGRGGLDEGAVHPAAVGDLGQQRVEQHQVGAGLDLQVQHVPRARLGFGGVHGHGAAWVHHDEATGRVRLAGQQLALFVQTGAAQVGHPVVQEVVGLRLQGVGADDEEGVRESGVVVAVVQLAHAHVAGAVHLAVVGRAVVDADVPHLHALEVELAGGPDVLVAASGAAVVVGRDEQPVLALLLDHPACHLGDEAERVVPTRRVQPAVAPHARLGQARARAARHPRGQHLGHPGAADRAQAGVHHAVLVGLEDEVHVAPVPAHHVVHGGGVPGRTLAVLLPPEVRAEGIVGRGRTALAVHVPSVSLVAAADDAPVADGVGDAGVAGRNRQPADLALVSHRASPLRPARCRCGRRSTRPRLRRRFRRRPRRAV